MCAALRQLPCVDGAYFAWADDDDWEDSTIAPMPKGDVCRFVAAIAGFARTYKVRAVCCHGGIRFVDGEQHEVADVLDMIEYDETISE
eukprot:5475778-Alexandrium_andersonii.AAC.1